MLLLYKSRLPTSLSRARSLSRSLYDDEDETEGVCARFGEAEEVEGHMLVHPS